MRVDASAILEVLFQTPVASRVSRFIFAAGETLHAPHLIDLEVVQVMRRYVRSGMMSVDRGTQALTDFADFPLTRYPHFVLLQRVWQFRDEVSAYDAAYLALAQVLKAPLITRDRALAQAGIRARVHVI